MEDILGNTRLELNERVMEIKTRLEDFVYRLETLEQVIAEPFQDKLDRAVRNAVPQGEAIAVYGGIDKGWNAYVPLADEKMTKELAEALAADHNEKMSDAPELSNGVENHA